MSKQTVKFLDEPISDIAELEELEGKDVSFRVGLPLDLFMLNDYESCLDAMSDAVVNTPDFALNDFTYTVVGATDDGLVMLQLDGVIYKF